MKAAIITILALGALSVAVAVTSTAYSDTACANQISGTVLEASNPLVVSLNTCTKSYTVGQRVYYVKYTACTSDAATTATYGDSSCLVQLDPPASYKPGACLTDAPPGIGSFKVSCSSTGTTTLAVVAIAAAALAFCL